MQTLLMVCYGGGHVKIIEPLYQKLKADYHVKILALTLAAPYLRARNIEFLTFADFPELLTPTIKGYGEVLCQNEHHCALSHADSVAYLGLSYAELITQLGSVARADKHLQTMGRAAFLPLQTLQHIITKLQPDAVITTNVKRAEIAALMAAQLSTIPSICINDNVWIEGGVKDVANLGVCDEICVLNQSVKEALLSQTTFPEAHIHVTGTPVFDALKSLVKQRHLSQPITVLLADSDLPATHPRFPQTTADPNLGHDMRTELNRLAKIKGWRVMFRPHPNQTFDYERYPHIELSSPDTDLHQVLLNTDVVVTAISTVGIEGKSLGCGLVSIEGSVFAPAGSYAQLGLATGVKTPKQLETAIMHEAKSATLSTQSMYDGLSTDNIAQVIQQRLNHRLNNNDHA